MLDWAEKDTRGYIIEYNYPQKLDKK
jgi:hypothetical protein